jgi:tetratricopeptide (TPR) repeat protein
MELTTRPVSLFLALTLLGFCLVPAPQAHSEGIEEQERLFVFAGQLMEDEDYYRAITEYKRFISYFPEDRRIPLCHLNIAHAYLNGGKIDTALEQLRQIGQDFKGTAAAERADYEMGRTYFISGRYEEAGKTLSQFITTYPLSGHLDSARVLLGWSLVQLWELEQAAAVFSEVGETNLQYPFAQALAQELRGGVSVPRKSPLLAGVMSGILPGAGQAYTGRYSEGFTSFLLNGAFIWAIVELFSHGNEVAGLVLGFFEVGWYSGGVFGAVNDAHKYNRKARKEFIQTLLDRYPLEPNPPERGP